MAIDLAIVSGFTGRDQIAAAVERLNHRRAAGGLGAVDLRHRIVDETDLSQLFEGLATLGRIVPPAVGTTTCCGSRQPSCSAISKPYVLAPSV